MAPGGERALDALVRRAREAWPEISVEDGELIRYVTDRLQPGDDPEPQLEALHAADLYLACACTRGDARAIAALEGRYAAEIDAALLRIKMDASARDDVKQRLRHKLFVSDETSTPRIATYTGRGDLGRWLKVAATREALNLVRKGKREVPAEESVLAGIVSGAESQELQFLKSQYRIEFKGAFQEAFGALGARERTILKYYTLDGLNIDEIGAVYGVHRATVARWIENIRHTLLQHTRETLMARIRVNRAEFESIMRLIQSQLDVSMHRLLVEAQDDRAAE